MTSHLPLPPLPSVHTAPHSGNSQLPTVVGFPGLSETKAPSTPEMLKLVGSLPKPPQEASAPEAKAPTEVVPSHVIEVLLDVPPRVSETPLSQQLGHTDKHDAKIVRFSENHVDMLPVPSEGDDGPQLEHAPHIDQPKHVVEVPQLNQSRYPAPTIKMLPTDEVAHSTHGMGVLPDEETPYLSQSVEMQSGKPRQHNPPGEGAELRSRRSFGHVPQEAFEDDEAAEDFRVGTAFGDLVPFRGPRTEREKADWLKIAQHYINNPWLFKALPIEKMVRKFKEHRELAEQLIKSEANQALMWNGIKSVLCPISNSLLPKAGLNIRDIGVSIDANEPMWRKVIAEFAEENAELIRAYTSTTNKFIALYAMTVVHNHQMNTHADAAKAPADAKAPEQKPAQPPSQQAAPTPAPAKTAPPIQVTQVAPAQAPTVRQAAPPQAAPGPYNPLRGVQVAPPAAPATRP